MFHKISLFLRPFKNALILGLVALALYQTGQLWFVSITNRNFFYTYFMSLVSPAVPDGHKDFVTPYRIVSGSGDGNFDIRYNGLPDSDAKVYGDAAFTAILKYGDFMAHAEADYDALLRRPIYIYEYAFPMPADIFSRAFGLRSNPLASYGISYFNAVAVQPPLEENENLRVFFLADGGFFEFALRADHKQEPSTRYAHVITPADTTSLYYVSATLEDMENISPGAFIARCDGNLTYAPVMVNNPYANNFGEKLLWFIQNRVEIFFANPLSIKASVNADGVYTYSDANTVVRYYQRDVLEYASRRAVDRSSAPNFMTDYSAAISFIGQDRVNVTNEYYLAGYRKDEDVYTFYFNYVINDMPLVLPQGWPSSAENGHPMEVTVDHGTVVRYRKLAYNFNTDENKTLKAKLDAKKALEGVSAANVRLGYRIETKDSLSLYWFWDVANGGLYALGTR